MDRRTATLVEAAKVLGIGKNAAYDAAKRGEIPTIRIGKRLLVPIVLDLPPAERKQLGARFQEYTQRTFSWELSAAGYAAAINDAIAVRQQARQARHEAKRSHAVLDQASRERKAKRIIDTRHA